MRDADLARLVNDAITRAQITVPHIARMRREFRLWAGPSISSGFGGASLGGGRHSDPTAVLAARLADNGYDPMREHDQIQRDVLAFSHAAERLHRTMLLATTIVAADPPTDDECMNCAAASVDPAPLAYEKSKASRLCRFCYDFRRQFEVVPAAALCRGNAVGRRITNADIAAAHPDLDFTVDRKGRWHLVAQ